MIRSFRLFVCVGEQCDVPRSFDGSHQFSLMFRTGSRDASGKNFSAFGNIFLQSGDILIINGFHFIDAERANFSSGFSCSEVSVLFH